ncbi:MAG: hypothetical protein ACPG4Y_07165 [Chitinophagales bacterium]
MIYKIHYFLILIIGFNNLNAQNIVSTFEKEFKLQIIVTDTFESSFENVNYQELSNEKILNKYVSEILIPEFKKYPDSYFKNINLKQIILCKNLNIDNQHRAAIPDPKKNTLLLSIDSFYEKLYLKHVLHHEMHHITEYALWQDMFYNWKKWNKKNTRNFVYGTGGYEAYETENKNIDWYKINNPIKGFVNLYSTLGQEEDRCEIVALLMTSEEKLYLNQFIETDKNLKRKVNLTLKTLAKVSGKKLKYWKEKLKL